VWASHCHNESGLLDQYAAAMHHLATDIWPLNSAESRIEWCHMACVNYFFSGGLKRIRDKAARRQKYQHCLADAEDRLNVSFDVESANHAAAAVESTASFAVGSLFTP